ncbi:MAG TPA: histidine ammonia-lyase, partial [Candidatus Brachybacterium intestinipullorum]|nr:histidine ammonia-lyase [Candidatus Brachybacterium intestinipullorum]
RRAVDALTRVLAIELMAGARGLELRSPLAPAPATAAALAAIRERVDGVGPDRRLAPEIETMTQLVRGEAVKVAVESVVGPLG